MDNKLSDRQLLEKAYNNGLGGVSIDMYELLKSLIENKGDKKVTITEGYTHVALDMRDNKVVFKGNKNDVQDFLYGLRNLWDCNEEDGRWMNTYIRTKNELATQNKKEE